MRKKNRFLGSEMDIQRERKVYADACRLIGQLKTQLVDAQWLAESWKNSYRQNDVKLKNEIARLKEVICESERDRSQNTRVA